MTYYHASQQEAVEAAAPLCTSGHWAARAELEPYNGWVIVLTPVNREVYDHPLGSLLAIAELELGRVRQRPASHRTAPPLATGAKPAKVPPPPPPPPPPPTQ